jgi:hypothetical protein
VLAAMRNEPERLRGKPAAYAAAATSRTNPSGIGSREQEETPCARAHHAKRTGAAPRETGALCRRREKPNEPERGRDSQKRGRVAQKGRESLCSPPCETNPSGLGKPAQGPPPRESERNPSAVALDRARQQARADAPLWPPRPTGRGVRVRLRGRS